MLRQARGQEADQPGQALNPQETRPFRMSSPGLLGSPLLRNKAPFQAWAAICSGLVSR